MRTDVLRACAPVPCDSTSEEEKEEEEEAEEEEEEEEEEEVSKPGTNAAKKRPVHSSTTKKKKKQNASVVVNAAPKKKKQNAAADAIVASTAAIPSEASPAAVVDVAGNSPNHIIPSFYEAQSATAGGSTHGASYSRATRLKCSHGNVFNSKRTVASGTAAVEQFVIANLVGDNDFCLAMLEHLGRDEVPECAETQHELERMLHNRCFALFNFYNNIGFMKLYDDAVAALCDYDGKERPFDAKLLLKLLSQYAFVVTPRIWTKTEMLPQRTIL
jgi:hypothetical protein